MIKREKKNKNFLGEKGYKSGHESDHGKKGHHDKVRYFFLKKNETN